MTDTATRTKVIHVHDMPNCPDAVYIGRAVPRRGLKKSPWANPYIVGKHGSRSEVVDMYNHAIREGRRYLYDLTWLRKHLHEIAGHPLACWCRRDGEERTDANACHGDVLCDLIRELGLEPTP